MTQSYDDVQVAIVWPNVQQAPEGRWLAEIKKLIDGTHSWAGETDVFLEAIESS